MLFIFPALPCMFKARVEKLQHPSPPLFPTSTPFPGSNGNSGKRIIVLKLGIERNSLLTEPV